MRNLNYEPRGTVPPVSILRKEAVLRILAGEVTVKSQALSEL